MKYYFYNNEVIENKLMVKSDFTNSLQIKFASSYSSSKKIKHLVFSNVILDYEKYKDLDNKEEYKFYQINVNVN